LEQYEKVKDLYEEKVMREQEQAAMAEESASRRARSNDRPPSILKKKKDENFKPRRDSKFANADKDEEEIRQMIKKNIKNPYLEKKRVIIK
jgi:hypothetical protein